MAGATAAELDDTEEEEKEEKDGGSVPKGLAYTPPTKPKKGKAALPYKRDRVILSSHTCLFIIFPMESS